MRKNSDSHSESYSGTHLKYLSESHSESHLESNFVCYLESHLESHLESQVNISHLFCELKVSENYHSTSFQKLWVVVVGGWCTEIITSALLLLFLN